MTLTPYPVEAWYRVPTEPGWWLRVDGDAGEDANWWQEPPEGWVVDPNNIDWWFNPAGDIANDRAAWWYKGRVQKPAPVVVEGNWYDPVFARARLLFGLSPYLLGGDRTPGLNDPLAARDCIGYVMEALDAHTPPLGGFGLGIHQGYINAERARQACTLVPRGQEEPGDLIFFQGTYNTPGASHVGIVLDPARTLMADDHDRGNNTGPGETNYGVGNWPGHFMTFARVPR